MYTVNSYQEKRVGCVHCELLPGEEGGRYVHCVHCELLPGEEGGDLHCVHCELLPGKEGGDVYTVHTVNSYLEKRVEMKQLSMMVATV